MSSGSPKKKSALSWQKNNGHKLSFCFLLLRTLGIVGVLFFRAHKPSYVSDNARMEIRTSSVADIRASAGFDDMVREYTKESGNPDLGEAAPSVEFYERMEAAGSLKCVGAFDGARLVGLIVVVASLYPHFGKTVATVESLWLHKDYRDGPAGLRLIRQAQEVAKSLGAVGMYFGARHGSRLEQLYSRLFTPMNVLFWKRL